MYQVPLGDVDCGCLRQQRDWRGLLVAAQSEGSVRAAALLGLCGIAKMGWNRMIYKTQVIRFSCMYKLHRLILPKEHYSIYETITSRGVMDLCLHVVLPVCRYLIREWTLLTQLHRASPQAGLPTEAVNRRIDLQIDQLLFTDRYGQKNVFTKSVAPTARTNTDNAALLSPPLRRAVITPSQL
jgi:hypothetical protein